MAGTLISSLIEKMDAADKDFRYMAINDLICELRRDTIKLDEPLECRIFGSLLRLLNDSSSEIQNLSIECMSELIRTAKPAQIELVLLTLCANLHEGQPHLRDVSPMALKATINKLPMDQHVVAVNAVIANVLPSLLGTLIEDHYTDLPIRFEVADVLCILIERFGRQPELDFSSVEDVLFLLIKRERQALRKRTITVLGRFVKTVSGEVYDRITRRILHGLKSEKHHEGVRAYVLAAETICGTSTYLFVNHLDEFVKWLLLFAASSDEDNLMSDCLHAIETFILNCGEDINKHLPAIIEKCSVLIKRDPNYVYSDEDGDNAKLEDDDNSQESMEDEYSDDDDLSWKTRRAAAKCLGTIITNKSDQVTEHFGPITLLLLSRFKEREESVKLEVLRAYEAFLKLAQGLLPDSLPHLDKAMEKMGLGPSVWLDASSYCLMDGEDPELSSSKLRNFPMKNSDYQEAVLQALSGQINQLVRAILYLLMFKSNAVRLQCFSLLKSLVCALKGALNAHFKDLMPAIEMSVMDLASNTAKVDTLNFLNFCFCSHQAQIFYPHLDVIVRVVIACINENHYKIVSAALLAVQSLMIVMKSFDEIALNDYVKDIYEAVIAKLCLNDVDQEVKVHSIQAAGVLLSTFNVQLQGLSNQILTLLINCLCNEMTRESAIHSFNAVVSNSDGVDLSFVITELLNMLTDFLRKNQRALRMSALALILSFIIKYKTSMIPLANVDRISEELHPLIVESDVQINLLALKLTKEIIIRYPSACQKIFPIVIPACNTLLKSEILATRVLNAIIHIFELVLQSPTPQTPDFINLMNGLVEPMRVRKMPRPVCQSTATVLAYMAKAKNDRQTNILLLKIFNHMLTTPQANDSMHMVALFGLGELGRIYTDIFNSDKNTPMNSIVAFFGAESEELKNAASYSLGSLASGDIPYYLPLLLQDISRSQNFSCLLLYALKEVILHQRHNKTNSVFFNDIVEEIWNMLIAQAKMPQESTRNIVAECLSKLCDFDPGKFFSRVVELAQKGDPLERCTIATAVRFLLIYSSSPDVDKYLRENLIKLLDGINHDNLNVKRSTIMTLNSVTHTKPKWVKDLLPVVLPAIYRETAVNSTLIHEIEIGPFKHVVDDGLDLRRSAYECLFSFMEHCMGDLDVAEYLSHVEMGLKDRHDIVLLTLLLLSRLANTRALQILHRLSHLHDLFISILRQKIRSNAVKQENEKLEELKKACIRTILVFKSKPILNHSPKLTSLFEYIEAELQEQLAQVRAETG